METAVITKAEYDNLMKKYQSYIATKKSLEMKIRMNEVWLFGRIGPKADERRKIIDSCKIKLVNLVPVIKPVKPVVYYVYNLAEDCFEFCIHEKTLVEAHEIATETFGKNNYKIATK